MKLYAFGHSAAWQSDPSSKLNAELTPACILQAKNIRVLWSSWCDSVISSADDNDVWTVRYRGKNLTSGQAEHITSSDLIRNAASQKGTTIDFFGSVMHEGLRGYVVLGMTNEVFIFSSNLELESGVAAIQSYQVVGDRKIASIRINSGGAYLVSTVNNSNSSNHIVYFDTFESLRGSLESGSISTSTEMMATFNPVQWFVNSTTVTARDSHGMTYTATRDPRYPKSLGRAYTHTTNFEPVDYLSETSIGKIASGGYMTAAVSSEGELFLWGQANPGSENQDETVKCLNVMVQEEEAFVYDVAVGYGHVLVAAEVQKPGCATTRAVLRAGCNSKGQLGLPTRREFVEDFEAIAAFKDVKIQSLVATGWSTLVVTCEE
jgi:hypothetical protein